MKYCLALVLSLVLSGCWWSGNVVQNVPTTSPEGQSLIQSMTAKINEKEAEAKQATDKLTQLNLELEAKQIEQVKLKQQMVDNDKEIKIVKGQIKAEQNARLAMKLYLTAGALGAAALILVVLGVFLTKPSLFYAAFACGVGAALATFVATLVPYLMYISVGVGVTVIGAMAYMLIKRHTTLTQVVTAVEGFKDKMPGYKEHFNSIIDDGSDALITSIRGRLALKKLTAPVPAPDAPVDPRGATTVVTKAVDTTKSS